MEDPKQPNEYSLEIQLCITVILLLCFILVMQCILYMKGDPPPFAARGIEEIY